MCVRACVYSCVPRVCCSHCLLFLHFVCFDYVALKLQTGDLTADSSSLPADSCLRCRYQVCLDKGTFDAISLTPDGAAEARQAYKRNVKRLLQPSGIFLITSCNWTKEELMEFFQTGAE